MKKATIIIADDSMYFTRSLKRYLSLDSDLQVVAMVSNGVELIKTLKNITPDLILMDIQMPHMNGIEATEYIREHLPAIRIIVLTNFDSESNIIAMTKLGVKSFLDKKDITTLSRVIKIVLTGGIFVSDQISIVLRKNLINNQIIQAPKIELNPTEVIIIQAICEGLSSAKIGKLIHKSPRTVEDYRHNLYEKFDVDNKEQLITKAVLMGCLSSLTSCFRK